jgi:hypothetical protein
MGCFSIPIEIDEEELIARFIFDSNFKRKNISKENLVIKDVFLPNKGGVSTQRLRFCTLQDCKNIANSNINKFFAGVLVFKKSLFINVKEKYVADYEERKDFEADLFSTPLDVNNKYLSLSISRDAIDASSGNPSHSDIVYINPAPTKDESPNTAIRSFSRKLAKECDIILDEGDNFSAKIEGDFIQID